MEMRPESVDVVPGDATNMRTGEADIVRDVDGSLFMAYTHFRSWEDDAAAEILSRRSPDGGRSWSEAKVVVENEGRKNVAAVSMLQLAPDRLLLFYQRQDSPQSCILCARASTDGGKGFGPATFLTSDEHYYCLCNDSALVLSSGRLLLPFTVDLSATGTPARLEAGCLYSDDGGTSWRSSNTVFAPESGAMEPKVVELKDGRFWMLLRTDQGTLYQSYSENGGERWSGTESSGIAAPQAPFVLQRIPTTGDIILIRNPTVDLEHHHQGMRSPLTCTISTDEGKSWEYSTELEPDRSLAYSYASLSFFGEAAVLSYYVELLDKPIHTLRVTRVPTAWFYQ
jgi:sialidase-1